MYNVQNYDSYIRIMIAYVIDFNGRCNKCSITQCNVKRAI
jgi:hypothetical protein